MLRGNLFVVVAAAWTLTGFITAGCGWGLATVSKTVASAYKKRPELCALILKGNKCYSKPDVNQQHVQVP